MEALHERQKADSTLKSVTRIILKQFKADTIFVNNFLKSQQIWTNFLDAEMSMKYPVYPNEPRGSSEPMCWSLYRTQLVNERVKKLMEYLVGIDEGDICRGSVPSEFEIKNR